uniref:Uncharacterized protein n=1 Tax=Timema monikensis TaxID=170555 RepID=A0A7R9E4K4_9NEOP|nr:unnamed protein product [Timema monikensis]
MLLQLILGDNQPTALLARNRTLGVVLAFFQMRVEQVQLHHRRAAITSIVAGDTQPDHKLIKTSYPHKQGESPQAARSLYQGPSKGFDWCIISSKPQQDIVPRCKSVSNLDKRFLNILGTGLSCADVIGCRSTGHMYFKCTTEEFTVTKWLKTLCVVHLQQPLKQLLKNKLRTIHTI